MHDQREPIMARLFAIIEGLPGYVTVARNAIKFDDKQLPAISLIEGDERDDNAEEASSRVVSPQQILMLPQIFIRLQGDTADVGTALNALRSAVIQAVCTDATLQAIVGIHGQIRYASEASTFHVAREMLAATALVFAIRYRLDPFGS